VEPPGKPVDIQADKKIRAAPKNADLFFNEISLSFVRIKGVRSKAG
jgi:hypothetical protein